MRAIRFHRHGPPEVLTLDDAPAPRPGPRDLLVAVRAAAVNPVDAKIRAGSQRAVIRHPLPVVPGMDLAGDVVAVGEAVTGFAVGDAVFASPDHRRMGAYAELAVVSAAEAAHKPRSIDYVAAASLPLAALTAWDALVRHGRLARGDTVLVQAGAGGVGSLAVQLAKHLGAHVIATASKKNESLVRELGADVFVDYATERYEDVARGCALAIDTLGGEHVFRLVRTVRRGGRVVALTSGLPEAAARYGPWLGLASVGVTLLGTVAWARLRHGVSFRPIARRPDGEALAKISALVDEGALRPVVDEVLPLHEAARAHARLETGHGKGKIVLAVA